MIFLKKEDLDFREVRTKVFLVNSQNEVLIAFNNNTYQFLGGHLEDDESLEDCIKREIREETGISITNVGTPFLQIVTYDNDYFGTDKKVENNIYYYKIKCDDLPDFNNTQYDSIELQSEFKLFYIKMNELENFLNKSIEDNTIDRNIGREMLLALDEYDYLFGGVE